MASAGAPLHTCLVMTSSDRPEALESERDDDVERLVRARRRAAGFRTAARRALRLARRYRAEEGRAGGARESACVAQAQTWRAEAKRVVAAVALAGAPRPGLARARESAALAAEVARQIG